MKGYLSHFKSQILTGMQYKVAAIAGILTQAFWGIFYVVMYKAFYSHTAITTINFQQLMSYVWLNQAFLYITAFRFINKEITDQIHDGTVAYELCRPYNLYLWWFIKTLAKRYSSVMMRMLPVLSLAFLLPKPYGLSLPFSINSFIFFIITLFLGSLIVTAINMIIHTIGFYLLNEKGIRTIIYSIAEVLSGFNIPVLLLPNILIKITEYLPFRLVGDLPFRIYSGNIMGFYLYKCVILQIIWLIILIIISYLLMIHSLKKVSIQGG